MQNIYGTIEAPEPGGDMRLTVVTKRGEPRWKLETLSGKRRKRQYFRTHDAAKKALACAERQLAAVGRSYDLMSAREKAQVAAVLHEIREAGFTLPQVWTGFKSRPNAPKASRTLKQAVAELLEAKRRAKRRPRHLDNMEWYLGRFIQGREEMDVSAIGEAQLTAWFQARNEAPRSQKQHTGLLSALFDHCWRKRYIPENPVDRLEKIHIDQEVPKVLTLRQAIKAAAWARRKEPKFLAWLTLALFCGMRPDAEADFIDWGQIDLERGRIVITKSKVRAPRIIDLSFCPPALYWLRVAKQIGSPLPLTKITRRRYMRKLRAALRLEKWPQDVLRHTAASNLLAFHQDAGKVAAFLGNSAGVLLRAYKALVFKEDAAKFMACSRSNPLEKPKHFLGKTVEEFAAEASRINGRFGGKSKRKGVVQCGQS